MAGRPKTATQPTRYAGLNVQTSALGVVVPIVWGTGRVKFNVVWYNGFQSQAIKGGKGGAPTTGYNYWADVIMGICEGPITAITKVFKDTSLLATPAAAGLSYGLGAIGQSVWGYLSTKYPSQALGYSGLVIAYASHYALDSSAALPNHSAEIKSTLQVAGLPDANPKDILTDWFTNSRYGVPNWPAGALGDWTQYGTYCLAANLLLSPVVDTERTGSDFLKEILQASNSDCVWSEGLLKIIPYGDTAVSGNGAAFTPNLTPVYALNDDSFHPQTDGEAPITVDIEDQSDAYNIVQVDYLSRTNQYNSGLKVAQDMANIAQYGRRKQSPISLHSICDDQVAMNVAQLLLQRTLYIRGQYKFILPWSYALLEPMDIVTITDTSLGLNAYPVRIVQIDEDEDNCFSIIAEDVLAGVSHAPIYSHQDSAPVVVNTAVDPGGVEANLLLYSGDVTQASWVKTNCTIAANVANDQYGLATADAIVPSATSGGSAAQVGSGAVPNGVGSTNTFSTSIDAAAGSLLVGLCAHGGTGSPGAGGVTSFTDSVNGAYTAETQVQNGNSDTIRAFHFANAAHLPTGSTATETSGIVVSQYAALVAITGAVTSSPLDKQGAGTTGTGTAPSIATGTLSQAAEIVIGYVFIANGDVDAFTEASGWTTGGSISLSGGLSIVRWAYKVVSSTASVTYNPTLGTSRNYLANVMSYKLTGSSGAAAHAVSQTILSFAGLNYTAAVCIQKNAHKCARVTLSDAAGANGAYIEVDVNAGVILTPGTAIGSGLVVSAQLLATLVSGIWQVVVTAQVPGATYLKLSVNGLDDGGNLSWVGDGSNALNISQAALRQGTDPGVYAATGAAAAGPVIFNPPSVLARSPEVWAAAAGGPNWGGCYVWTSIDGSNYEQVGTIELGCRYGSATTSLASNTDPDTTDTVGVDLSPSGGSLIGASQATADNGGTLCLIDNELICYETATLTNPSRYTLGTYIRRGYLGTPIAAHAAGAPIVRLDGTPFQLPYAAPTSSQLCYVKFQSFNPWGKAVVALSDCIAYPFTPMYRWGPAPAVRPPGPRSARRSALPGSRFRRSSLPARPTI